MKRTPLKAKRDKPRRNEGRVTHGRVKSSRSNQADYHRHLRETVKTCEGCGCGGDLVLHHILARLPDKLRRDERYVIMLCPGCHNMGTQSVHLLGSEAKFYEVRGVDLVAISVARWRRYSERQGQ